MRSDWIMCVCVVVDMGLCVCLVAVSVSKLRESPSNNLTSYFCEI